MSAAQAAGPARDPRTRGALTICVMLATVMQTLDTTIANVALPYMSGTLAASPDQINWVLTSYIVASAIMTPPTGWLAARFGRKRLFLVSVAGFTAASALCGAVESLGQMVAFRLVQGAFGAALVPLSQAVLLDTYPRERQGSAMAIWGMGVMVGPILGPTLGGWLTENYSWRWVFYINLPIGVLALMGMAVFLSETSRTRGARLDWFGFGTLSIAVGALQFLLDRGEQLDWFGSTEIVTEAVVAALAFYLFLVHILTAENPFTRPALFKDTNFSASLVLIFAVGAILLATLSLLTPFLQTLMGYPVVTAGLVLAPRGVGTMAAMLIVGRLVGRLDIRALIAFGLILTAAALWEMTGFTLDVSQWTIIRTGLIQGLGLGFVFVPLSTAAFTTLPAQYRTEAAGLFNFMRNIGSSIGISITSALLVDNTQLNHAEIARYVSPFNRAFDTGAALHVWNPHTAAGQAALNVEVTRQATTIAFIDDFKLMMATALLVVPLVLLLRQQKSGGAPSNIGAE
jgi:DHA2 family multidrug resistance protein